MILAIDIGNTNTILGSYDHEGKMLFLSRVATDTVKTEDQFAIEIKNVLSLYNASTDYFSGCIVSSVVPPITSALAAAAGRVVGEKPLVVGPGLKTGLNIKTDNPAEVGSDIAVSCVAAINKYSLPAIVIDMGTATKMSVIDKEGSFIGCSIMPGVRIGIEALSARAAQLPHISLEAPQSSIGKNTVMSMRSGVIFGAAGMLDSMIDRINGELGEKATVIATGGLSGDIIPHCKKDIILDQNLVMDGLFILYLKNQPKSIR